MWGLLCFETYRLPGAKRLGEQTPPWVAWLSVVLLVFGLAVMRTLFAGKQMGPGPSGWLLVAALAAFGSQMLFLSIWLAYDTLRLPGWTGMIAIGAVLGLAVLTLWRNIRARH